MDIPADLNEFPFEQVPFDIIGFDKKGKPILLIEIKATHKPKERAREWLIAHTQSYMKTEKEDVPFAMLIDDDDMEVFQLERKNNEPIITFKTATALSYYEPEYGKKPIYYNYFVILLEAWLDDLAYRWKSEKPPLLEEVTAIGLLEYLHNGTTKSGERLSGETVY
ncbi:MAG: hypothetical protein DSM107014_13220 [Gomphosphaeria aponina SAG 52.96 = DSM 107014]|uniref:Type I restriction enzyme R protein N-terminal domain-containing protein n=1 Tax=Gomphosphaeria aponina SAG 52.96 = DSM 107014 TaxID=1521640 RepID=A0A941GW86_9CHRO|nr:hypothetical protein [Gomphosphaeria aponina SAG 52.96 = DSM 107014]